MFFMVIFFCYLNFINYFVDSKKKITNIIKRPPPGVIRAMLIFEFETTLFKTCC